MESLNYIQSQQKSHLTGSDRHSWHRLYLQLLASQSVSTTQEVSYWYWYLTGKYLILEKKF